jgi:transposase
LGQVIVMVNLGAHKDRRVKVLIETRGRELLDLPPYPPGLNPIEETFSKIKGLLRQAGVRTRDALVDAMGVALHAVSVRDAHEFFARCGYRRLDRPPSRPL